MCSIHLDLRVSKSGGSARYSIRFLCLTLRPSGQASPKG
jgi:hypothetical protein